MSILALSSWPSEVGWESLANAAIRRGRVIDLQRGLAGQSGTHLKSRTLNCIARSLSVR